MRTSITVVLLLLLIPFCRGQEATGQAIDILFLSESEYGKPAVIATELGRFLGPNRIHIHYSKVVPGLDVAKINQYDAVIFSKNPTNETRETSETASSDTQSAMRAAESPEQLMNEIKDSEVGFIVLDLQNKSFDDGAFGTDPCGGQAPQMYPSEPGNTPSVAMCWTRQSNAVGQGYALMAEPEMQLKNEDVRSAFMEMILSTVGKEVVADWKRSAPEPLSYSTPQVPIPNYENPDEVVLEQAPLSPDESMAYMQLPPGFEVQLFAAEPDIVNPVSMAWDEKGRLWVIETLDYPNRKKPLNQGSDKIKILEDTDGDGRADKITTFAEGLSIATGLTFMNDGVIVSAPPEMLFLKDTDGDDKADVQEVLFDGFLTFDTHAGVSNLRYGLDNWIWMAIGYAGFEGIVGEDKHQFKQGLFRLKPDMSSLDYLAHFSNNTWGLGVSENGDVLASTANNEHSVHLVIPERYFQRVNGFDKAGYAPSAPYKKMHPITDKVRQADVFGGYTAAAGHALYTARHFPKDYWNRAAFVNEPTGHLVHQGFLKQEGTQLVLEDGRNLMASADEWAAPIMSEVGPDGALWVLDWYNLIIQHNPIPEGFEEGAGDAYETPLRDLERGRIYRIVYPENPLDAPMVLSKEDPAGLIDALSHPNMFWRTTAQRLLVERGEQDVVDELIALVADRSIDEVGVNGGAVHALWTLHGLGLLDGRHPAALEEARRALFHQAPGVRRTAIQVLPPSTSLWSDLQVLLVDGSEDPLVVLETLLKLPHLPASGGIGQMLYRLLQRESIVNDPWLSTGLALAAAHHMEGYLRELLSDRNPDIPGSGAVSILPNSSFEEANGDLPTGWQLEEFKWPLGETNPNVYTHAIVDDGRSGRALQISSPTGADVGIYTMVPVKPNTDYLLTGWIKTENVENVGGGYGAVIDVLTYGRTRTIRGTTGWTWVEKEFNSGSATEVRIQCHLGRWGQYKGTAWFDDLRLVEKAEGSAASFVAETVLRHIGAGAMDLEALNVLNGLSSATDEVRMLVLSAFSENWPSGERPELAPSDELFRSVMAENLSAEQLQLLDRLLDRWAGRSSTEPTEPEALLALELKAEIGTLRYDQTTLTATAGQLVKLTFENPDAMPHNVVIGKPGSLEVIGNAADALATSPDGAEKDYTPDSEEIIIATPMIQSGGSFELTFVVPDEPGDYPFLCTFPGHWRIMNGVLTVVE